MRTVVGAPDPLLDSQLPFARRGARRADRSAPLPWGECLAHGLVEAEAQALREATRTGRPCGGAAFVRELEEKLSRPLDPQKRGPQTQRGAG